MTFQPQRLTNKRLLDEVLQRSERFRRKPLELYPWLLGPCKVRTLLVADGIIDFSGQDFGLSTFVSTLVDDGRHYVEFEITLAHLLTEATDAQVQQGASGIARSIKDFCFDNPDHFAPGMYDQVWLFGSDFLYHRTTYATRNNNQTTYPADQLSDQELINLSSFMNDGGGLFATGDHGLLGKGMSQSVARARSMRLWDSTSTNPALDEVSMAGPRRNDTTRGGHDPGSQFDDQSDDIPQEIQPKLYSARVSPFFGVTWPHPLLCGPTGIINVLPDHPHEGECVVPANLANVYLDGTPEYPDATDGSGPVAPEIIARSTVPAGNDASGTTEDPRPSKSPTFAHSFGAISAYDGHRAGIGRVVCDATWHHFLNINLIGDVDYDDALVKGRGFLASASGEEQFEKIKAYYRNIGVWISPPASQRCFRRKLLWSLLYQHRVLEAVLATTEVPLERADSSLLFEIGAHARDVLGHSAGRCLALQLMLDLVREESPSLIPHIDPWLPDPREPEPRLPPFVDPSPLLDMILGGALLALREQYPTPSLDVRREVDECGDDLLQKGAAVALRAGLESFGITLERYTKLQS